jgi:hypothetical protein
MLLIPYILYYVAYSHIHSFLLVCAPSPGPLGRASVSICCEVMSPDSDLLNMSSSSESFKFPKLGGSNYPAWSVHMQSALQSRERWLIVTGDEEAPEKPNSASVLHTTVQLKTMKKEWLEWLSKDQAAMGYIKGACDKGTSGSIYGTLGRGGGGSLKGLLKFLEGKKFHTCGLLSTYFLTSKCHIQPEFDDGAPLNLQTHSTHQVTYLFLIWVTKPEYGNRQAHSS